MNKKLTFAILLVSAFITSCGQNLAQSGEKCSTSLDCEGVCVEGICVSLASITSSNKPVNMGNSPVFKNKVIVEITCGNSHFCAIDTEGTAYCWGLNNYGQLGNGTTQNSYYDPVPVDVTGVLNNKQLKTIGAGWEHTCAIDNKGKAYCWGRNDYGQLGDGSNSDRYSPVAVKIDGVLKGKRLSSVSASAVHTCAIDENGSAFCWGRNLSGRLGNGTEEHSSFPVEVISNGVLENKKLVRITTSSTGTMAVDVEGAVYQWGNNYKLPVKFDTSFIRGESVISLSGGYAYECIVDDLGFAYCGGNNNMGKLGNGDDYFYYDFGQVISTGALKGSKLVSITTGYDTTCAIDTKGRAYCWGSNTYGQLGNGESGYNNFKTEPVAVYAGEDLKGKEILMIEPEEDHTCALDKEGVVYCWGNNVIAEIYSD